MALVLVGLISVSRLYLGLHLPIDVLGGLVIAALFLALVLLTKPWWSKLGTLPRSLQLGLGLGLPFLVVLAFPPPGNEPDLIMGGLAAFLMAPLLVRHHATGPLWKLTLLALLGVTLVFAALTASNLLLPEDLKRNLVVGFFRYLFIGYIGIVLVPWLGQRLQLVARPLAAL